jgi:chemotaxis protein MotB
MSGPEDDDAVGAPEWMVLYSGLMSLLLGFFIMLVSLSEFKDTSGSLREAIDAIRETFGPTSGSGRTPGPSTQTNSAYSKLHSQGMRSEGGTKKASRKSAGNAGAHKTVQRINHGTVITLGGPTLFQPFEASLSDAMRDNLDIIVAVIADKPQRVMVRGHASPEPLLPDAPFVASLRDAVGRDSSDARFDHFDLSFARARNVARYLIQRGIARNRLIVSASGDAEPRISTRNADKQSVNRRVDVFLIDSYITRPSSANLSGK